MIFSPFLCMILVSYMFALSWSLCCSFLTCEQLEIRFHSFYFILSEELWGTVSVRIEVQSMLLGVVLVRLDGLLCQCLRKPAEENAKMSRVHSECRLLAIPRKYEFFTISVQFSCLLLVFTLSISVSQNLVLSSECRF